jgi:hypothetical protein
MGLFDNDKAVMAITSIKSIEEVGDGIYDKHSSSDSLGHCERERNSCAVTSTEMLRIYWRTLDALVLSSMGHW